MTEETASPGVAASPNNGENRFMTARELLSPEGGGIRGGDIFYSSAGTLHLALDSSELVNLSTYSCIFMTDTWLMKYTLRELTEDGLTLRRYGVAFDREKSVALGRKLAGRHLPYHVCLCTKSHWWNYIVHGKTHKNRYHMKSCPLARPLDGVSAEHIASDSFVFLDSRNTPYYNFREDSGYMDGEYRGGCIGRMCYTC